MWILMIYLAGQAFVMQSPNHGGKLKDTTFKSVDRCLAAAKATVPNAVGYSCVRR